MRATYRRYNRKVSRKRTIKSFGLKGPLITILVICLAIWSLVGPFGLWKLHRMRQYRKELYLQYVKASEENTRLKNQLEAIKRDKKFQEDVVRTRLGWVKKDEILFKFIPSNSN